MTCTQAILIYLMASLHDARISTQQSDHRHVLLLLSMHQRRVVMLISRLLFDALFEEKLSHVLVSLDSRPMQCSELRRR